MVILRLLKEEGWVDEISPDAGVNRGVTWRAVAGIPRFAEIFDSRVRYYVPLQKNNTFSFTL